MRLSLIHGLCLTGLLITAGGCKTTSQSNLANQSDAPKNSELLRPNEARIIIFGHISSGSKDKRWYVGDKDFGPTLAEAVYETRALAVTELRLKKHKLQGKPNDWDNIFQIDLVPDGMFRPSSESRLKQLKERGYYQSSGDNPFHVFLPVDKQRLSDEKYRSELIKKIKSAQDELLDARFENDPDPKSSHREFDGPPV